jgi:hypothetical protein
MLIRSPFPLCRSVFFRQHEDYKTFLKDRIDTLRLWRSVKGDFSSLDQHYSLRGLEQYQSAAILREITSNRNLHRRTVFQEQHSQKKEGRSDPERIKQQVVPFSALALNRAIQIAEQDEAEVRGRTTVSRKRQAPTTSIAAPSSERVWKLRSPVVDTVALKQMNLRMLKQMRGDRRQSLNSLLRIAHRRDSLASLRRDTLPTHRRESLFKRARHRDSLSHSAIHRDSLSLPSVQPP